MGTPEARFRFGSMISDSPVMEAIFARARGLGSDHLYLHGESGVGMHTLARVIAPEHRVELAAQATPESLCARLLEEAMSRAAGGTLVLACFDQLPEQEQLKVLQAAGQRARAIRWIFIDYRGAHERMAPELPEVLRPFALRVPPLRERGDDAVLLAGVFLEQFSASQGRQFAGLSPQSIAAIRGGYWWGNVRALACQIVRAIAVSEECGPTVLLELGLGVV